MLVFLSSLAVFLASVALAGAIKSLPPAELRRQARTDKTGKTASIYKLVSYGSSLDVLLGILVIASFIGSVLAAVEISWWLVGLVFLTSLAAWLKDPNGKSGRVRWSVASYIAYPADWLLRVMHPLFKRLSMVSKRPVRRHPHTRVYDKEDLLELLNRQARQPDNRISGSELDIARSALTFGDKAVSSIMTPKKKVKFVSTEDSIGPHLMDELHDSGQTGFPVVKGSVKSASPEIVGTLYLGDVLDLSADGKVKSLMKKTVYFISEEQSLSEALTVFLKTHHGLLIVVNNFKEIAGTLSLQAVVGQIIRDLPDDEFEHYDKLQAVAGLESKDSRR